MNGVILRVRNNGQTVYHHSNINSPEWVYFNCRFPIWKNARYFDLVKE